MKPEHKAILRAVAAGNTAYRDIAAATGLTENYVSRHTQQLIKAGYLTKNGSDRSLQVPFRATHWAAINGQLYRAEVK